MCGIAGILGLGGRPVALDELRAMSGMLVHRGPDDDGYYLDAGVGLTMRRLSIIDLESGRQPVRNEDGSVWVVFNGEIYNYRELRRELQARGHTFATTTDTEVIVHLYEELGPGCVDKLRGHVRLRALGRREAAAPDRPRPPRDQAALLRRGRRTAAISAPS